MGDFPQMLRHKILCLSPNLSVTLGADFCKRRACVTGIQFVNKFLSHSVKIHSFWLDFCGVISAIIVSVFLPQRSFKKVFSLKTGNIFLNQKTGKTLRKPIQHCIVSFSVFRESEKTGNCSTHSSRKLPPFFKPARR